MTPEFIDRYQILSELGRGGMAIVYQAFDPQQKRKVAIKVLPREYLNNNQFRARFQREIKILTSFREAGVVPVYGYGQFQGQPYLVMQYMSGGSLEHRLRRKGAMTIAEAADLLAHITPALDAAHRQGIVHRDLKPSNILFDEAGQPYIADFGIARLTEQAGKTTLTGSMILGTPAYMSPEQARGNVEPGPHSDVYSLGVVLFEMLTGKLPYKADTPMQLAMKHLLDPVPDVLAVNPNLPRPIKKVITTALAKKPEERYATSGELAAALAKMTQKTVLAASGDGKGPLQALSGFTTIPAFQNRTLRFWGVSALAAGAVILLLIAIGMLAAGYFRERGTAIALAQSGTATAAMQQTIAAYTPTPAATTTPTPTQPPFAQNQAGIHQGEGASSFLLGEQLRVDVTPLPLLIYHENGWEPPGFLFAFPGSVLVFNQGNDQGFQLSLARGGRIFLETGLYPQASVLLAGAASRVEITVDGSAACLAVDYPPEPAQVVFSCYEGQQCGYAVLGGDSGTLARGEQVLLDPAALTVSSPQPISPEEAGEFAASLPAGTAAHSCALLWFPLTSTPTPAATILAGPTSTLPPTKTPKEEEPVPTTPAPVPPTTQVPTTQAPATTQVPTTPPPLTTQPPPSPTKTPTPTDTPPTYDCDPPPSDDKCTPTPTPGILP